MNEIEKIIYCPNCESSIVFTKDKKNITCTSCEYKTFTINNIPWFFKEPSRSLAEWKNRYEMYLQSLSREGRRLDSEIKSDELLKSTVERLKKLQKSKKKQIQLFQEILGPLNLVDFAEDEGLHQALKTKVPLSQDLMSYYTNVHRDWCWGEDENRDSFDLVSRQLKNSGMTKEDTLVSLGSGASRLSYDIHCELELKNSLAVDINPLYLLLAKKIIAGESVKLYEYPLSPKRIEEAVVLNSLQLPEVLQSKGIKKNDESFKFLFADILSLPFKSKSLNYVLTPWIVDIIPQDIDIFFRQLNRVLKLGGHWVNFGSFAFSHKLKATSYSYDEMFEVVKNAGFEIVDVEERQIPYLNSPYSCQKRFESVVCFSAKKIKEVEQYEEIDYLPSWIKNIDEKIPPLEEFKTYTFVHKLHFELFSLANGENSISDIVKVVIENYKMSDEQAVEAVNQFFVTVYEENLFTSL